MTEKAALRCAIREKRAALSADAVAAMSATIVKRVWEMPELVAARRVLCYADTQNEVSTRSLIADMLRAGYEVYLPKVVNKTVMKAVRLRDISSMEPGVYGVDEPVADEACPPDLFDVICVPGVAFDRNGGRIGYGAGYYDRYLVNSNCVKIGLAYEMQLVDAVPRDAYDVQVDGVITEKAVYGCMKFKKIIRTRGDG